MGKKSVTWQDVEAFLAADLWIAGRKTGHDFYEKLLPNGELLRTHISRAGSKGMSPGRFRAILRNQLKVGEDDFWEAIRAGRPAARPSEVEEPPPQHAAWVVRVLVIELHLTPSEIQALSVEDALRMVNALRSRPRD